MNANTDELDWIAPVAEPTEADALRERIAHLNQALYVVQCHPGRAAEFAPLLDRVRNATGLESSGQAVTDLARLVGWTR